MVDLQHRIERVGVYLGEHVRGIAVVPVDGAVVGPVFTDGLAVNNSNTSAMAEYNNYFYIGLRNLTTGGELWRSEDGSTWSLVFNGGLGNPDNARTYGLQVYDDYLYVSVNDANQVNVINTKEWFLEREIFQMKAPSGIFIYQLADETK